MRKGKPTSLVSIRLILSIFAFYFPSQQTRVVFAILVLAAFASATTLDGELDVEAESGVMAQSSVYLRQHSASDAEQKSLNEWISAHHTELLQFHVCARFPQDLSSPNSPMYRVLLVDDPVYI